jgi:hypothetical protein
VEREPAIVQLHQRKSSLISDKAAKLEAVRAVATTARSTTSLIGSYRFLLRFTSTVSHLGEGNNVSGLLL